VPSSSDRNNNIIYAIVLCLVAGILGESDMGGLDAWHGDAVIDVKSGDLFCVNSQETFGILTQ
jgi:hypothetical protein